MKRLTILISLSFSDRHIVLQFIDMVKNILNHIASLFYFEKDYLSGRRGPYIYDRLCLCGYQDFVPVDRDSSQIFAARRPVSQNIAEQTYAIAAEIPNRVREIVGARGLPESDVFEWLSNAVSKTTGVDLMLAPCFDGALDYEESLICVGRTYVKRAERERVIVEEDADWGLNA